jgi:hypothetical protein
VTAVAELGETTDPKELIPGDATQIRASTAHLTTYGDTLIQIGDGLTTLETGGWTGDAADKFHAFFDGEPVRWTQCGDAFHSAAAAINNYAGSLDWAQGEAAHAVELWQQGEQATNAAQAQHDQAGRDAAQKAATAGEPPPAATPFSDTGAPLRTQAKDMLARARDQLTRAGNEAVGVVDKAQQDAPQEPSFLDKIGNGLTTAAGWVGDRAGDAWRNVGTAANVVDGHLDDAVGGIIKAGTNLAGDVVSSVGDTAGTVLSSVGLDDAGKTVKSSLGDAGHAVDQAGQTSAHWLDDRAHDLGNVAEKRYNDVADFVSGDKHKDTGPHYVLIDENKYPESAEHVQEAQSGLIWRGADSQQKTPKPEEVTIDRAGADINRRESLNGIATRSGDYLDRDEYPPAMFAEGGAGASVKYIDASDNRGSGSSMGHQLRGLHKGDKVHIVAG